MSAQPTSCCSEVGLRLRTSTEPHVIRGYEVLFSITSDPCVQVVRWNSPLGNSDNSNHGFTCIGSVTRGQPEHRFLRQRRQQLEQLRVLQLHGVGHSSGDAGRRS